MIWIGSPNFWEGRDGKTPDRIVIHWADGTLASTDQVFQDTNRQTSAHYGIENTTVHQYVKESDTAWHSGNGDMNVRSIGIEHSAAPGRPATAKTISTSANLIAGICKRYKMPCDRVHILKHSEVIPTQCPGTVPIDEIIRQANVILKGTNMAIIQNSSNWKARCQKSFLRIRGRDMSNAEFKNYVGKDFLHLIEALEDNKESDQWYNYAKFGRDATALIKASGTK